MFVSFTITNINLVGFEIYKTKFEKQNQNNC